MKPFFIPPRWWILILSLFFTAYGVYCCFSEREMVEQGLLTYTYRTSPFAVISAGLVGVFFSSFCVTVSDKRIICHYLGIIFRRLYWVEFTSGIAIRKEKAGRGEEGKIVVLLTLRGTPDFEIENTTSPPNCVLDKAVSKYASLHPIGVIKIIISKKEMETQCLETFSKMCPNFHIIASTIQRTT